MIVALLSDSNPYCSFAMKNHWLKAIPSQKTSQFCFRCSGRCTFSDCPVTFSVRVTSFDCTNPPSSLHVNISFSSSFVRHHKQERQSRQITGKERATMKENLLPTTPASLYNKTFSTLTPQEIQAGKRDKVGRTPYVYQKMSSQANKDQLPHFDLITSLMKLDHEIVESSDSQQALSGLIRRVTAKPSSVSFFSEEGIRIYQHHAKKDTLYLDATGSIISLKGTIYESDNLYYALVIGHPELSNPPIAVAELISTEHSVMAISHFLQDFRRHKGKLYGYANMVSPKCCVIDRSLVLLLSFLQIYNMETLIDYLHRCFRIMTGCQSDEDDKTMLVFACISHVMKSAKYDMKKLL